MSNLLLCLKDNQGNISLVADYGDIAMVVVPESNCIMKNGHTIHFANKEVAQALANEFWKKVGEKPGKESTQNFFDPGRDKKLLDEEVNWLKLAHGTKSQCAKAIKQLEDNPEFITNRDLRDKFYLLKEIKGFGKHARTRVLDYMEEIGL